MTVPWWYVSASYCLNLSVIEPTNSLYLDLLAWAFLGIPTLGTTAHEDDPRCGDGIAPNW